MGAVLGAKVKLLLHYAESRCERFLAQSLRAGAEGVKDTSCVES